ncbi:MAG: ATP-binding cassette domain-containing protein [Oleispira antarctica]|nr:ATP-binding cassette domain-containing protein [Oleispira antarctica]MBQ0792929.1 ATP-binding cassette domain-containing protein [Oleispira antarctica]
MFKLDHYQLDDRLNDITLNINSGEKVALLGPSGGGKTSLLNVLHQQCADQIAWCPQEHGLVEALSGYHNMYMGQLDQHYALYNLANLIKPLAKPKQAISELSVLLGLDPQQDLWKSVSQLSGGQRQRIGIGRALFRQKESFLGDEPVSSLDPVQAQQILELILNRHKTVILALHNRQQALSNFDRIIGIKAGRIVFDSPAKELIKNKYQAGLLDSLYE